MSAVRILPCIFLLLFLHSFAQQPRLVVPIGHTSTISEIKHHPDGKTFISISKNEGYIIKGWERQTGRLNYTLEGLNFAGFSNDAKKIVALNNNNTCEIYDAASGLRLLEIKGGAYEFNSAKFSSRDKYLVTIAANDSAWVLIWNAETGKLYRKFPLGAYQNIGNADISGFHAEVSPDEKQLAMSNIWEKSVQVLDIRTGKLIWRFEGDDSWILELKYSPGGNHLFSRSLDNTLKLWDCRKGKLAATIPVADNLMSFQTFSSDGKYLLTGSALRLDTAFVWRVADGHLLFRITDADKIGYVKPAFSPEGKYIAYLTDADDKYQNGLKIIECSSGKLISTIRDTEKGISGDYFGLLMQNFLFNPDSKSIITINLFKCAKSWDIKNGRLLRDFDTIDIEDINRNRNVSAIQFNSGGRYFEKLYSDNMLKVYDYQSGRLENIYLLNRNTSIVKSEAFNPGGHQYLTISTENKLKVWNRYGGELQYSIDNYSNKITSAGFSPDGKTLLTTSHDGTAKIWNAGNGSLLQNIIHPKAVFDGKFRPDGKYIVTVCADSTVKIFEVNNGNMIVSLSGMGHIPTFAEWSPDGKKLLILYRNTWKLTQIFPTVLNILDVNDWSILYSVADSTTGFQKVQFSPDNAVLAIYRFGTLLIWDWINKKIVSQIGDLTLRVNNFQYTPDQKHFVWSGNDTTLVLEFPSGKLKKAYYFPQGKNKMIYDYAGKEFIISGGSQLDFYEADNFTLKYSVNSFDNNEYIIRLPSGYYKCLPGVAKQLYYINAGLKHITFEQLDVKYNRPDKVLEAIGNTDTALIKSYRKAWEKRIKKLGIDTTQFRDGYSVPECDFVNRDAFNYEQKTGTLQLHIKGNDSTYKLDRFNVWVNESPLFGQSGISIKRKNSHSIDTSITIKLSQGENRIETSITNVNGTESYRMPLYVNYAPAVKQKESLRFIGIGIDQFADSKYNLKYSAKDIRDLSKKLKEKYKDNIIIDTLFNENVTVSNVKALKQKLQQTTENDKVIISYSGHGMLSKEYDYYLSTYSVNFEKPEENGLPYDELENLLDSIPARKKLMVIDACHSGEVDKEELTRIESINKTSEVKGLKPVAYKKEGQLGLKNSFELMQSLFVNVGKSTGATIISAAAGTQFALERGDLKNGVFTNSILEAMDKNPTMKISELKKIVGERVEQLTNGLQKPTSRNETIAVDWNLW